MASPTTAQEWRDFEDRYREWHLKVFHEYPPPVQMQASDSHGPAPTPTADAPTQTENESNQAGDQPAKKEGTMATVGQGADGATETSKAPARRKPGPRPKAQPDTDCFETFNTTTTIMFDGTKKRPAADVAYVFKTERMTILIEPGCETVENAVMRWLDEIVRVAVSEATEGKVTAKVQMANNGQAQPL